PADPPGFDPHVHLRRLAVTDFRSWEAAELDLTPGVTVLVGPNGVGKTNLVEAAGYLATLGSHRVATDAPLIRRGAAQAVVRGQVVHLGRELSVELEITSGRANRARVNRAPAKPRDVLGILRTVLFAPEDLALVRGDPGERRRFLDELLEEATAFAGIAAHEREVLRGEQDRAQDAQHVAGLGGRPVDPCPVRPSRGDLQLDRQ